METYEKLISQFWEQKGRSFGPNNEFCLLVKGEEVMIFNKQYDSYVISPFSIPLKKRETIMFHELITNQKAMIDITKVYVQKND